MSTVAALLLGAVFLLSAITKLAAPAKWRAQAAQLIDAPLVGRVLPWVEVVMGALLVSGWQRHRVAIAAGALLVTFNSLLAVRLREGRRPPCACFGSLSSRPISWLDVGRNMLLILVALAAAV
jgi:Methylamine utilisation protein MauE